MRDLLAWLFGYLWQAFLVFGPVILTYRLQKSQKRKKSDTRCAGDRTSKR